ncbi:TRAP transporter large permease [Ramlibacter rhizophilus]|uniref:TRAP transporter large permease protein n=1 Tax=Ramlibacter rhizophilus TaxID=1781167 RepID=A0A4Z0BN44_9BURK|nr:TRAP transporter large permease [Ramlibacter rhizophilus]TFY99843.1 TRAP transporter large permease [Ramlibacter rhizophilus]
MIAALLLLGFAGLLLAGVPIVASLALSAMVAIAAANTEAQLFGLMAAPQNFYSAIAKYPLLALPMFVLVGSIFDRSGVAQRMVTFAMACLGRGPGMLPTVAIVVAMVLGGISGSGPANAAAVGGVMIAAMARAGYPAPFSATVVGAAAATDILIPPSIALVVYSVMVPGASVPALFAAGMLPGLLAGLALVVPAILLSRRHRFGTAESHARPPFWPSLRDASWGLAAPVLILGGMRLGWFTPTEAAAVAVAYGLFVGMVVHRSITVRDLWPVFRDAAEISAVIMVILGAAGLFSYAINTLGIADPFARWVQGAGLGSLGTLAAIMVVLLLVGTVIDGVAIFMIFVPLLYPLALAFQWDLVWLGVLLTLVVAQGQFSPPFAVNLMVSCRMAGVSIESTVPWVLWFLVSFLLVIVIVFFQPQVALWLPRVLGF